MANAPRILMWILTIMLGMAVAVAAGIAWGTKKRTRSGQEADRSACSNTVTDQQYRSLFEQNPDAVCSFDAEGLFQDINSAAERMLGGTVEEVRGHSVFSYFAPAEAKRIRTFMARVRAGSAQTFETILISRQGKRIALHVTDFPIWDKGIVVGAYVVAKDLTDKRSSLEAIERLVTNDTLTELPNRTQFMHRLDNGIHAARRSGLPMSLLLLDIDRFKVINDSLGHRFGDKLLQEVAKRLKRSIREIDVVARMGGDEFAILMQGANAELASATAVRILDALRQPIMLSDFEFRITVSIGICLYPCDGVEGEMLIRHAESAMYHAKEVGKNGYQFHSTGKEEESTDRLFWESGLHTALEQGNLVVYYQPQVNTDDGSVIGVEALVRWVHPERGLIPPDHFIPIAEETGLIMQIGEFVMRTACLQNKRWQDEGIGPFRVAVNLSMLQFHQHNLVDTVRTILIETGLEPRYLELEITESMAMNNETYIMEKLHALRQLGIHISMDDFGTGYSSLGYLKKFPVDTLKIDRSFVRDITLDLDGAAIVSAVIAIAKSLGIDVIAEGVELPEQLAFLQYNHCVKIQGYLFSPPVSADQLKRTIASLIEVAATKEKRV